VTSSIIAQAAIAGILYLLPSSAAVKNYSHSIRLGNYQAWTSEPKANLEARMMQIRRYLKGYGPATWEDFRHWSGLNIGEINPAIAGLEAELDTFTIESQAYVS
ncbi:crosslink repair DNA glycosylase YcaQ family protein, partial [Listeria rocourtiae]|uniref:DNA glycosylase AlkZ-like family protein n=1 Tax=Listeria rocourtiae TaxID=647910 RepID=UPI003D2F89CA